ncbi:MAG: hypothetical protein GC185_06235 [Alphaproteobacteria bacterium]|nr:hypothetical protein [Alphaproteobacteria bacterium]
MTRPANWNTKDGFDYALFPAKTEKPDSLVIYMHGIGDNAENFESGARVIQEKIPGAAVIALQAPIEIKHPDLPPGQKGYSWFPYGGPVMPQVKTWLSHVFNRVPVVKKVENFAHARLEELGLKEDRLAYVGNSMGAIVALQAGLSPRKPVAAVVSRGGTVPPFTKARNKSTKVLLQMGEWDEIFNDGPPARAKKPLKRIFNNLADRFSLRHERSVERLKKKRVPMEDKIYEGQGHMLDAAALADGADFIGKALGQKHKPQHKAQPQP